MKKLEDIFVTFTEDELDNTLTTLAEWCEGGYLLDDMPVSYTHLTLPTTPYV